MREQIISLDANGAALDVGGRGFGFRITPARRSSDPSSSRPGAYPITVAVDSGREFQVTSDESRIFSADTPFNYLKLSGGEAGDFWKVTIFETADEGTLPPSARAVVPVLVQSATAMPAGAPALATDGFKVRPGTRSNTFACTGAPLGTARLWVRTLGGQWIDTLEDLDFTTTPIITRAVYASADRVYLRQTVGTMTMEVNADVEVG